MPEDIKKNDRKNAKEQRKPRQRHQQSKVERKPEKIEEDKSAPKVPVPQKPPVHESPPPEFFKNLKRETDEIVKITEEENSKYKKKEIQSNWSKYEVQIESYDDIDEQENLGADFEKLIQAPLVAGGHFQFKHEKSWDVNTGPTQYDKYFEIDMDNLSLALCTIPFYERNNIEQSIFKESDILTMNNRATKFKQKYFNDKSYTTPEIEVQDRICNSLREGIQQNADDNSKIEEKSNLDMDLINNRDMVDIGHHNEKVEEVSDCTKDIDVELNTEQHDTNDNKETKENIVKPEHSAEVEPATKLNEIVVAEEIEHNDFIFRTTEKTPKFKSPEKSVVIPKVDMKATSVTEIKDTSLIKNKITTPVKSKIIHAPKPAAIKPEVKNNPVIESPEDLEKWLDDFLDE